MAAIGRHSRSLDEAHERVHWSQQIEHALALQMHYTAMALVRQDELDLADPRLGRAIQTHYTVRVLESEEQ